MALIFTFLMGIANFALHKAVLESGHPLLLQVPWFYRTMGGHFSMVVEFMLLLGTLLLVGTGATGWAWGYLLYSAINGFSAWLILTRRV
jgi:hypothetical protein